MGYIIKDTMEPVDNIINNNDVVHEINNNTSQENETSSRFEEIEKQFNELKDLDVSIYPELEILAIAHNEIKDIDLALI